MDNSFEDRMGFIKKVYVILTMQLAFTAGFVLTAIYYADTFAKMIISLNIMIIPIYIGSICALVCCDLDKKLPINYILISIFTFSMSWMVATLAFLYPPDIVFSAATLTFAVSAAITVYAATTKNEFSINYRFHKETRIIN